MLYHGWSDRAASALSSIGYYEAVERRDPDVRSYFRMFMMPGVLHCGLGPGPDTIDWIAPIVEWVQRGRAPDRSVARTITNGSVARTRPLCPYPRRAAFVGGNPDDELSFACR